MTQMPLRSLILCLLLAAQPAICRVWIRWTEPQIPSARSLGISDVAIRWSPAAAPVIRAARAQGYTVYLEADVAHAEQAAGLTGIAGLMIDAPEGALIPSSPASRASRAALDHLVSRLHARFPSLPTRLVWPGGKEPELRGTMVVSRNGVLQVSSPTRQPWIDSNVALGRFERTYDPHEKPIVEYQWEFSDPLEQKYGPPAADYELAIAEAGAFRMDLILPIAAPLQQGLARGIDQARNAWREIGRYLRFYAAGREPAPSTAEVAVVTNDFDASYEAVNLLARHNISFRVVKPDELADGAVQGADLWLIFGSLDPAATAKAKQFAQSGRTVVWVGEPAGISLGPAVSKTAETAVYSTGQGKIVTIAAPIIDPEPFARDVWRLLTPAHRDLSLWNALTVLAAPYSSTPRGEAEVDLVNYALEPLRTQVRIKGNFSQILYATPETGCCRALTAAHSDGFTEFVTPQLRVGARVRLLVNRGSALSP